MNTHHGTQEETVEWLENLGYSEYRRHNGEVIMANRDYSRKMRVRPSGRYELIREKKRTQKPRKVVW